MGNALGRRTVPRNAPRNKLTIRTQVPARPSTRVSPSIALAYGEWQCVFLSGGAGCVEFCSLPRPRFPVTAVKTPRDRLTASAGHYSAERRTSAQGCDGTI